MILALFIVVLGLLTSCQQTACLRVRTEYIDESYLARSQIGSSRLLCSCFCGEQLVIRYKGLSASGSLKLSLRFSDHQIQSVCHNVENSRGYWVYRLMNEEYQCKGPILSYKVELYEGGQCLAVFSHLWGEPIE